MQEICEEKGCQDQIVERVRQKLLDRSNVGIKKYNTTLYENNSDDFLNHALEEAMDFCLYIEKLKSQKETIKDLIIENPNDSELGLKIRQIFG
jgi:hypothetical protein